MPMLLRAEHCQLTMQCLPDCGADALSYFVCCRRVFHPSSACFRARRKRLCHEKNQLCKPWSLLQFHRFERRLEGGAAGGAPLLADATRRCLLPLIGESLGPSCVAAQPRSPALRA